MIATVLAATAVGVLMVVMVVVVLVWANVAEEQRAKTAEQIPNETSASELTVSFRCDCCGEMSHDPGAIFLSPPDKHGMVLKEHICVDCYATWRHRNEHIRNS